MDWIMIVVQLILAGAAIWYTIETRRLRLENQGQMKLLKEQTRLSLAPYLVPGLVDVDLAVAKQQIQEDQELSEEQKKEMIEKIEKTDVKYMCMVDNPTTKIGHHLNLWVYDSRTRSFLECDYGKEWIAEKDREMFQVSEPYFTLDEVRTSIGKQYGSDVDFITPLLEVGDKSHIVLVFRDIEGRLYAVKRPFRLSDDGDISHSPSAMYFAV